MPRVGNKEFPYTDEGMRQANIFARQSGQRVEYKENSGKFGYQRGGEALGLGDRIRNSGERSYDDSGLLDESIGHKIRKSFSNPLGQIQLEEEGIGWDYPQWIKNFNEASRMMEEGYDRYGSAESTWPAFKQGIKETFGMQEGGFSGMDPDIKEFNKNLMWDRWKRKTFPQMEEWGKRTSSVYDDIQADSNMRKRYMGEELSRDLDDRLASNINLNTVDDNLDIRDIVTNISAYNKEIDPMMETRSVTSPRNLLTAERDRRVDRLLGEMGYQEGGEVDARRPKMFGF